MKKNIKKIEVKNSLVILHGDEMAQVAFDKILDQFVRNRLEIDLLEINLSAKNRLKTNGNVVNEAIEALKCYGVGIKNAGITVNAKQLKELVEDLKKEGCSVNEDSLAPLATKSPNGAIRKGINGNITREDIPFKNLQRVIPKWVGRDIVVDTMDNGGLKNSFNQVCPFSGLLKLSFIDSKGNQEELHSRPIQKDDIYLFATNDIDKVNEWARNFFQRALDEKRDAYVGLKDTVIPGYDGTMRHAIENIFKKEFKTKFSRAKLIYEYGLIDAQAARMVSNPPNRCIWGVPDNTSGRKMLKLVEALKEYGIPQRRHQVSISRMSAGGGDQYGSFNIAAKDNGVVSVSIGQRVLHSRDVKKGDPMILMTNHPQAIREWVQYSFAEARKKNQEMYFGLKREYMPYDAKISDIILDVQSELAEGGNTPPEIMIMRPSMQLIKMIVDPPMNAHYAALNLDGDIFSDITAALGGSLATASSIIASADGTMLFEAPHGTAPDLYESYIKTKGKNAHFNSSALLYAVANALEVLANREKNEDLKKYSDELKAALIKTVEQGLITGDLKGKTTNPKKEKIVDMHQFLDAIEKNLDSKN